MLTEFGSLIPGLKAGRFDIIAAGMFINPKRCAEIAFSGHLRHRAGDAGQGGQSQSHQGLLFIHGKQGPKVGRDGRSGRSRVCQGCRRSRRSTSHIARSIKSPCRSPVGTIGWRSAHRVVNRGHGKEGRRRETTTPFGEVAGKSVKGHGGFGFRKEDTELYEAFNTELKAYIGTPEHVALVTPFGFGKDYLPNKTMELLCKGE